MTARLSLLFLLATAPACLAAPELVRIWPEYRKAEYFERIGEYFGAQEKHPGRTVLRSRPADRAGYYFLVRVSDRAQVPAGAIWRVELLRPSGVKPEVHDFAVPASPEAVFELGLTGADWPGEKTAPVAWQLSLLGAGGEVLASKSSRLWK